MSNVVADIFLQVGEILRNDDRRSGSTVHLDKGCDVLAVGDIHGNRKNLSKVMQYWDLAGKPERRIIFQEVIHSPDDPVTGFDRSVELLMRIARSIIKYPRQILCVIGNHDLAQITGNEITKAGRGSCRAFEAGVVEQFGADSAEIMDAMKKMFLSLPLAVRCVGGVFISHSLPGNQRMALAGVDILDRDYRQEDFKRGGSVYEWTWGRDHDPAQVTKLADTLGVEYFITGHQHVEAGYEKMGPRAVTITTDHSRGCVVEFNGDESINSDSIESHIRRVGAIGL